MKRHELLKLNRDSDEDMGLAKRNDKEMDCEESFPNSITEADSIIPACKDEAFVVTCFKDRWLATGGKDDQALLYSLPGNLMSSN